MNPQRNQRLKEIITAFVLIFITLAAFKFFFWHLWRVRQAYQLAKGVINAPAAVNISIYQHNKKRLTRGFPFNRNGNAYIIDRFDISALIKMPPAGATDSKQGGLSPSGDLKKCPPLPPEKFPFNTTEISQLNPLEKSVSNTTEKYQLNPPEKSVSNTTEKSQLNPPEKSISNTSQISPLNPLEKSISNTTEKYQCLSSEKFIFKNEDPSFRFTINGQIVPQFEVYSFPQYWILRYKDYYFVFTSPKRDIETLVMLNHTLPQMIESLATPRNQ